MPGSTKNIALVFIGGHKAEEMDHAVSALESGTGKKVQASIANSLPEIKKIPRIDIVLCHEETETQVLIAALPYLKKKFPNLLLPSRASLLAATDKYLMRQAFAKSAENISARYSLLDYRKLDKETKRLGREFPEKIIIKPSHNASSMYVSLVDNNSREIKAAVEKITSGYRRNRPEAQPQIVAEEYLQGPMYTVDVYVDKNGICTFCPAVYVTTGRDIGYNDFYGYYRIAPAGLAKKDEAELCRVTQEGIKLLKLTNSSAHAELRKTKTGWKIIEIGPRIGGYRDLMYAQSFGFNHAGNDALNRLGLPVKISHKALAYTSVIKLYPQKSGRLITIKGLDLLLAEIPQIKVLAQKKPGLLCRLASEGGFEAALLFVKTKSLPKMQKIIHEITAKTDVKTE